MMSESGGRAVVIAPSALGPKDLPAGLSKVPPRESARRYMRRRGSVGGMWRRRIRGEVLDMTIFRVPRAWLSETKSARRREGVSIFSLGVLVRGHGIHMGFGWIGVGWVVLVGVGWMKLISLYYVKT